MSKPKKKNSKFKIVLFILEILVLLIFLAGLFVYGQLETRLDILDEPAKTFEPERIVVNPEAPTMTGYTTYALFGIDHRDKNSELNTENSDTIIIASVNNDTKDIKMVSLYRDTLLNIGDGVYAKANAAYAYGGPEQAISMLNKNLDLDIKDYVTIDFNALVTAVDCVGGLDVPMSYAELVHMNNYCVETSEEVEKPYTPIELPERPEDIEAIIGTYHLNGVQATSYCRIRYTANLDMGRTIRQRQTIQRIVQKAKKSGLSTIFSMMDEIFPQVRTSLTKNEILRLLPSMIGYSLDETTGFPLTYMFSDVRGSIIVPTDLVGNVEALHQFLYGDEKPYVPTEEVKEYSEKIIEIVGGESSLKVEQAPVQAETENKNDDFIWYENQNNYTPEEPSYDAPEEEYNDYEDNHSGNGGDYNGGDYSGNVGEDNTENNTVTEQPSVNEDDFASEDSNHTDDYTDAGGVEEYTETSQDFSGGGEDYVEVGGEEASYTEDAGTEGE